MKEWIRAFLSLLKFWQKTDHKLPESVDTIPEKDPDTGLEDLKHDPEQTIILSNEEFDRFQVMLDNPPPPSPSLIELMKNREEEYVAKVEEEKVEEPKESPVDDRIKKIEEQLKKLEEQSMYKFSEASQKRLETCHPDLQRLMNAVIKVSTMDFTIVCGERNKKDQDEAYRTGKSKVQYPNSKHNSSPSMAVDIAPYVPSEGGIPWNKPKYFYFLAGVVLSEAKRLGIKVRWGGDFSMNGNFSDDTFVDCPHFELVE